MHKLEEFVDYKRDVRTCQGEILKAAKDSTELRAVHNSCSIKQLKGLSGRERGGDIFCTTHTCFRLNVLCFVIHAFLGWSFTGRGRHCGDGDR